MYNLLLKTLYSMIGFIFISTAHATVPDELVKDKIISNLKYLSQDKPLVIHFTSTSDGCRPCSKNNKTFNYVKHYLSGDFNFTQVNFNPWNSISDEKTLVRNLYIKNNVALNALPHIAVIYKGNTYLNLSGYHSQTNLEKALKLSLESISFMDRSHEDITPLPVITTHEYFSYIAEHSIDKPLIVHLTSTDGSSEHATTDNVIFKHINQKYKDKYNFVELVFNPYSTVTENKEWVEKLKQSNIHTQGIPASYLYKNGKLRGVHQGTSFQLNYGLNILQLD